MQPIQSHHQTKQQSQQNLLQSQQLFKKQEYLRTHISPDEYDDFGEFCMMKKDNLNIDSWLIDQVHELVKQFAASKAYLVPGDDTQPQRIPKTQSPIPIEENRSEQSAKVQKPIKQFNNNNDNLLELTPKTVKVSPKRDGSNEKTQEQSELLSIFEVMDLLSFQPQLVNYTETTKLETQLNERKQENKQTLITTKQKSNRPIDDRSSIIVKQPSLNSTVSLKPTSQIIKLTPVTQIPLQKRITQPSILSSSQTFPKTIIPSFPKPYKQQLTQTIPCTKPSSPPSSFPPQSFITIKKHQIIHKAFFLPDYVMYHVQLQPQNIICKRNYDDFSRLEKTLRKFYPGVKLPYLESNSWLSQTSIQFIKKQKVCLQFFLNQLLRHQIISKTLVVSQFLTVKDHKAIKRKFQQYEQKPQPQSIDKLQSLEGHVKITLSNIDNQLIQKSQSFSQQLSSFLTQYNDLSQSLVSNYDLTLSTLNSMSKLIKDFKRRTREFEQVQEKLGVDQKVTRQLPEAIKVWQKLIQRESISLSSKKQLIFQKFLQYTTYQQANVSSINPLLSHRQQLHDHYLRLVQNQPTSPSTSHSRISPSISYLSPQLHQYKSGLMQIPQNITVTKYHLAYWNGKLKEEMMRMLEALGTGVRNLLYQRLEEFLGKEKNQQYQVYCQLRETTRRGSVDQKRTYS